MMALSRTKKIMLFILLVSLFSYKPGAIEMVGVTGEKLVPGNIRLTNEFSSGDEFSGTDRIVNTFMRKWEISGASIAIAKDGRLVFARGFGLADKTDTIETEPFNRFRIASISKLVTAVAILKLQEEGKLSVDDKVFGPDGILNDPYFKDPKDKRVYEITVGHLLSHEAGWSQRYGDQMFMPLVVSEQMGVPTPVDTKTIIRFALNKRLHFTPGKGRSYSNLGYSILGLVIEKISGLSYEEYCRRTLFEPNGIYDMILARNLPDKKAPFEVTYYEPSDAIMKPSLYNPEKMVLPSYGGNDIEALGGAGAWLSTAPDLIRFMLTIDGFDTKKDILGKPSIEFMTDNGNGFAPVGWKTTINNGTWWRTGSFPGTACMMKRLPDGICWVVLLNTSAWNGPEIYNYINAMMTRTITQIKSWPEYDLFDYSLPAPVRASVISPDSIRVN